MSDVPHNPDAEASVVGRMIATPAITGAVLDSSRLQPEDFYLPAYRALAEEIVTAYWAQDPIDPVTIAATCRKQLAAAWTCGEEAVAGLVQKLASSYALDTDTAARAIRHAGIIRRDSDRRRLLALSSQIEREVREDEPPDEIAASASEAAMKIATSTLATGGVIDFATAGRNYIREQKLLMEARRRGVEVGAYFGLPFIDSYLAGLRGGEMWFLAGEAGAGKSAVSWKAVHRFAERQLHMKPADDRIGALVCSLEMAEEPSSQRWTQVLSGMDGSKLREGRLDDADLSKIVDAWRDNKDLNIHLEHTPGLSLMQLRAIVAESVRRNNTGIVLIDHWKYVEAGRRFDKQDDEDEYKARFLRQNIARAFNVGLIVLGHTVKSASNREDKRPKMADLRGSGWIQAHCDFISFVHRPYKHATRDEVDSGEVDRTAAEMLWEKCRQNMDGKAADFYFDPATMTIG